MPEHDPPDASAEPPVWQQHWFQLTLAVLLIATTAGVILPPLFSLVYAVRGVLVPVLIALGLAYVFNPLVTRLDKRHGVRRSVSSGAIIAVFLLAMLALSLVVVPQLVSQGALLFSRLKEVYPQEVIDAADKIVEQQAAEAEAAAGSETDASGSGDDGAARGAEGEAGEPVADDTAPGEPTPGEQSDDAAGVEPPADEPGPDAGDPATLGEAVGEAIDDAVIGPDADPDAEMTEAATGEGEGEGSRFSVVDSWKALFSKDPEDRRELANAIASSLEQVDYSTMAGALTRSLDVGYGLVGSTFGLIGYVMLTTLITGFSFFFFSWRFRGLLAWCVPYIPDSHRDETIRLLGLMNASVTGFIRGRLVQTFVMGLLLSVGWGVIDVPYWLLLGIAGGLLNLIPFAAFFVWPVAIALAGLEALGTEQGIDVWHVVVWPSVVYWVVQLLDGWVVEPVVQGKATNLNPLAVFLAVMVGGSLAGLLGMLLAIPAAACGKILMDEIVLPRMRAYANNGRPRKPPSEPPPPGPPPNATAHNESPLSPANPLPDPPLNPPSNLA